MKKVLLINSNTEVAPYPVAPLGLSLVASALKSSYDVQVLDFAFSTESELIQRVKEYQPNYIGISIRNIDNVTMQKCRWYLPIVKEKIIDPIRNFNVPIIVGGSGFNIAPQEILNYLDVDFGICGEGEESILELLDAIEIGSDVKLLNGVITKEYNAKIRISKGLLKTQWADIDKYLDFSPYLKKGSYPIQTKRGCTHKCIYCSYPNIEGNTYRLRDVKEIVDEIEDVHKRLPQMSIEFVDSTFNSPLNHALEICKEIISRKLKVKLRTMGVNPGDVTNELIEVMKLAGFTQIDCTPDSASNRIIKSYQKNFNKIKLIECAKIIEQHNMPTMWFFMMGAPGESEETIKETFEFIDKYIYKEDMVHITEGIRILPNTKLYKIALEEGVISKGDSIIEPMFYVDPTLGKEKLSSILKEEISKRNNVLNSIDTEPSKELMKKTLDYRKSNNLDEPMFRTLLRVENMMNHK